MAVGGLSWQMGLLLPWQAWAVGVGWEPAGPVAGEPFPGTSISCLCSRILPPEHPVPLRQKDFFLGVTCMYTHTHTHTPCY